LDGFSSSIERNIVPSDKIKNQLENSPDITVEAWVSLGAYPWNWAPILTVGKYRILGFYLGIDSQGRLYDTVLCNLKQQNKENEIKNFSTRNIANDVQRL
jgi:hypothetical protein